MEGRAAEALRQPDQDGRFDGVRRTARADAVTDSLDHLLAGGKQVVDRIGAGPQAGLLSVVLDGGGDLLDGAGDFGSTEHAGNLAKAMMGCTVNTP